jgi:hypothetical protein
MNETESQDDSGGSLQAGRRGLFRIFVCLAGAGVGAFFGSFEYPLGTVLGAVGGIVAGLLWTWIMLRRARAGWGSAPLVGTGWGIVVGLLATAILHGGLIWFGIASDAIVLGVAVVCAIVGGAITGLVCGAIVSSVEG